MPSLHQPAVGATAVRIGLSPWWQLASLPFGAVWALVWAAIPGDGFWSAAVVGAVFGLLCLGLLRMRVIIDGGLLHVREKLRWRTVRLDRLATATAVPSTRIGPLLKLEDAEGRRVLILLQRLRDGHRQRLCDMLRPFVSAPQVRQVGPVDTMLAFRVGPSRS
ncbi:hypothetical protein ACIHCX_16630 [Streptomyces sp. NPDC052043]|uniref:hypothetical protein n=1 Tax=Streptomyces sp. NPDC052043 TaxID=3365684 RepID=UPI0037CEC593